MKSKIKFDLNGLNEAVVSAQIIFDSEDVRDKVARTFFERLGYESNLAFVEIHPDSTIRGIMMRNGKEVDTDLAGRNIAIMTFGGDEQSSFELCRRLCDVQLANLSSAIAKEQKKRKTEVVKVK